MTVSCINYCLNYSVDLLTLTGGFNLTFIVNLGGLLVVWLGGAS